MPSATFTETVTIDADPANVWDQLQEPDVWASLGPVQKVWDPIIEDGVLTGFTWSTDIGGKVYEGTGKVISHQRPDRYELMLDTSEMSGTITANLSPANPGWHRGRRGDRTQVEGSALVDVLPRDQERHRLGIPPAGHRHGRPPLSGFVAVAQRPVSAD